MMFQPNSTPWFHQQTLAGTSSSEDEISPFQKPRIPFQAAQRARSHFDNTQRRGPRMASWIADPSKTFAVIDSTCTKMIIVPCEEARRNFHMGGHVNGLLFSTRPSDISLPSS